VSSTERISVASRLRSRTRTTTGLHDLIEDDARVIATEGFQSHALGVPVERGRYFRLSDPIVRQFPEYFAVVIPVGEVLEEIER
jgi:hypothetical protein